jgi:hypothetical protein
MSEETAMRALDIAFASPARESRLSFRVESPFSIFR